MLLSPLQDANTVFHRFIGKVEDNTGTIRLKEIRIQDLRAYRCHLRAMVRTYDGPKEIAPKSRSCDPQLRSVLFIRVDLDLCRIRGKACIQTCRNTRC